MAAHWEVMRDRMEALRSLARPGAKVRAAVAQAGPQPSETGDAADALGEAFAAGWDPVAARVALDQAVVPFVVEEAWSK